ncbi:hypothetical protein PUN28_014242 [Cardiocondyla obscurior]|uniref:Uncharacterized protein n=1 Tax=Cardiocondyla obscurior TaxID=286306 RepID=A0AAW2F2E4_9HYME
MRKREHNATRPARQKTENSKNRAVDERGEDGLRDFPAFHPRPPVIVIGLSSAEKSGKRWVTLVRADQSQRFIDRLIANDPREPWRSRDPPTTCSATVFATDIEVSAAWRDDDTSHLRGGAGPGRASCIGGATLSHRLISSTPLAFMQIDDKRKFTLRDWSRNLVYQLLDESKNALATLQCYNTDTRYTYYRR